MALLVALFTMNTQNFELPPNLLHALCYVESSHNVSAVHVQDGKTDSYGVCQVKYETAVWLGFKGTPKQLMLPSTNVYYAAKYLSYNLKRYNGDTVKAVIAYNRGNAKGLTTTNYSDKVFKQWKFAHRGNK